MKELLSVCGGGRDVRSTSSETECNYEERHRLNMCAISDFVNFYKSGIFYRINEGLMKHNNLKLNVNLNIFIIKSLSDGKNDIKSHGLRSACVEIFPTTDLKELLEERLIKELQAKYDDAQLQGSGWSLYDFIDLELHINSYTPLSASSYVALPDIIASKKAVINIQNFDNNNCFFYSVCCQFLKADVNNRHKLFHYTEALMSKLDFSGKNLGGATSMSKIDIFEKNNRASVNVYSLTSSNTNVFPLWISKLYYKNNH